MRFESMRLEHIDQVLEIEKRSFPTPWPRQTFEFEVLYNELAEYAVAIDNGRVVGYGGMWLVLDEAHITNVAVHPTYRGRHIGRALMLELIRRARARGATRVTLEVRPSNTVARNLYKSLGFVEKGIRRKYYQDNKEDAIIMWLEQLPPEGS
ncbi:MAG: Ribosomal-protein-alanine acetyltransferase [Clostridia bacterium 62_21]|nr:MAG: Ribosomal-protein-alanine acetyltransferase [Clostridia bacterium 62_21]